MGAQRSKLVRSFLLLTLITLSFLVLTGDYHASVIRILSSIRSEIQLTKDAPLRLSNVSYPSVTAIPTRPEPNVCWILSCSDRILRYRQYYYGPGFRHIILGVPKFIIRERLHPSWCRVGHLLDMANLGQRCVVYADDDVYLNLDRLRVAIHNNTEEVLVTGGPEHGKKKHINSGFVVFRELQGPLSLMIVKLWHAARSFFPSKFLPNGYLRDQAALNHIMYCGMPRLKCCLRTKREDREIGLMGHCFSRLDTIYTGKKQDCLRTNKRRVSSWDKEPLED